MKLDSDYVRRLEAARNHLKAHGVEFEPGLTDNEVKDVEERFSFVFPPDLRWFLQDLLPVSDRFPNWRGPSNPLVTMLSGPADGIAFDVGNRVFWWNDWEIRPESDDEAIAIARREIGNVPKLIPIFGHSYLPSDPCDSGNPVFSVNQADVIHRGANIAEFLFWIFHSEEEPEEDDYPVFGEGYRWIDFWSALVKQNAQ